MTHNLIVTGVLTTLTPFHMAHANVAAYIDADGRATRRQPAGSFIPCTPTYKIPVPCPREEREGYTIQTADVPVLPASSLRGKIRRHAARLVKAHFAASGQTLSRQAYHVLQVGAFAGNAISGVPLTPEKVSAAAEHPFAGVFGGGPALFPSRLRTFDSFLHCTETQLLGLTSMIDAPASLDAYRSTFAHPFIRRDDLLDFLDPLAPDVIQDYAQAFTDWQLLVDESQRARASSQAERDAKRDARKAGKAVEKKDEAPKAKKIMLKGQSAVEAVLPGANFSFELRIRGTKAQLGLVTQAVAGAFEENQFGGMVRNGYGRFRAALEMQLDGGAVSPFLVSDGRSPAILSASARELSEAWECAIPGLSASQFEEVYLVKGSEAQAEAA